MSETVGIAELRQNLSKHLRRVAAGERLVVTDRNRPVATLGPPPGAEDPYERLIAEGVIVRGRRTRKRFDPVKVEDGGPPLSELLDALREDRL